MLALVLENEPERVAAADELLAVLEVGVREHCARPLAHAREEVPRGGRVEERQPVALRPRVLERGVEFLPLGEERLAPAHALRNPQVLEVPDVSQVPDERRLERRPLHPERVVVERLEEAERRLARVREIRGNALP